MPKASDPFISDEKIDKSTIRIHSAHRWPEKIVFDTQLATIAPSPVLSESPTVINQSREAFAKLEAAPQVFKSPAPMRTKQPLVKKSRSTRVAAYPAPAALPAGW
jgi:hypothetical protein